MPIRRVGQHFGPATLAAIERAIGESEEQHRGEIRFVVEGRLSLLQLRRDLTARQRAEGQFRQLGIGNTEEHSGILFYILLAERQVEIVADTGITAQVALNRVGCTLPAHDLSLCCRRLPGRCAGRYRRGDNAAQSTLPGPAR